VEYGKIIADEFSLVKVLQDDKSTPTPFKNAKLTKALDFAWLG
jgi:hypothetical protein